MVYAFADFELDTRRMELRRAGRPVRVEPQVYEVLALLVRHRDRVVPREELLDEVWHDRFVSEATLSHRVMEARRAVGDDGRAQRMIRTVHGRGFRFVAPVRETPEGGAPPEDPDEAPPPGRGAELARLQDLLARARSGRRQTVFVTGEAGLGKTTLVEAMLRRTDARVARGQCLDPFGHPEPYLPVLSALGGLGRGPGGGEAVAVLAAVAPTWLAQLPSLVGAEDLPALQRRAAGSNRERMLREMGEALEALAALRPLVLLLEDLHWSDPSTLDLVAWVARRTEPAALMLLGTFRPSDGAAQGHPVVATARDLALRGLATEIPLARLDREAARTLLERRGHSHPAAADLLVRRTAGNPLFMGCLLDAWEEAGLLEAEGTEGLEDAVPPGIAGLIERQVALLAPEERAALEGAAVAGAGFATAEAAAAAGLDEGDLEEACHRLALRGVFLEPGGEVRWPDGTVGSSFAFLHDLYQEVLYRWLPAGRRARMHGRIAERLQQGWGARAAERAADLARHFERSGQALRASPHLALLADQALRRNAPAEADGILEAGLAALDGAPPSEERDRAELRLRVLQAPARIAARGWSDPEAERAFLRALELSRALGASELSPVLYGLATLYEMRGEYARSEAVLRERMDLGEREVDSQELMACSTYHQGAFRRALEHADRGAGLYDPARHLALMMAQYGDNPGVSCHAWGALSLWFLGHPDEAVERVERAVALARAGDHRFSLGLALAQAATVHQLREEPERALERAEEAVQVAEVQGFPHHRATADVLAGWAMARLGQPAEGLERLERGLAAYRATGARIELPYFLGLQAWCRLQAGDRPGARTSLDEARTWTGPDRGLNVEALLHLQEALLEEEPDDALRRALEVARRQEARSVELRAGLALAERLAARGEDARPLLEPILREAPDAPERRRARALLAEQA